MSESLPNGSFSAIVVSFCALATRKRHGRRKRNTEKRTWDILSNFDESNGIINIPFPLFFYARTVLDSVYHDLAVPFITVYIILVRG